MECPFFIGQKVVCIDDTFIDPDWRPFTLPQKNQIYSIRHIFICSTKTDNAAIYLHLNEIINSWVHEKAWLYSFWGAPNGEIGFNYKKFRPLKETNIEIFKKILIECPKELETVE